MPVSAPNQTLVAQEDRPATATPCTKPGKCCGSPAPGPGDAEGGTADGLRHERSAVAAISVRQVCFGVEKGPLGLALGIGFGLATGEGMIEEIALAVLGALIGGTLHTLIGGHRRGLKFLLLGALIGAMALILMHDFMEALLPSLGAASDRLPRLYPDAARRQA